ncbi:hypothetical protein UFOVP276_203 [uncultured Caudovirales phage]|uniref:Uncharacterized protein n=1 Tax=uncultured Caudovirales phage TaxID=2100421 RepID=A0A6J5LEA8_9CAUD|nr:hypothetical protein UFOVP127_97 [uncultured Caudovirales phage]CAB4135247.1 hypothetical protein UFOVP276_203 [uncultured Caudovirales phage]
MKDQAQVKQANEMINTLVDMMNDERDFDYIIRNLSCRGWHKFHDTTCDCTCTLGHTQEDWRKLNTEAVG